jgi:dihydrofolate reductase
MKRLIMWNMVTLDGYFEGEKPWDIDWHDIGWGDELKRFSEEQTGTADALLFGRVTYEGMAAYWPKATGAVAEIMNRIPKIVFSKTLEQADWSNTRLVRGPAEEEVRRLKQQPGKDLFVYGSAKLCATLTRAGLIDEYRLGLNPVVLGKGTALFKELDRAITMKLLEARPLQTGCVVLRYEPRVSSG